jgi:hypothetical protein
LIRLFGEHRPAHYNNEGQTGIIKDAESNAHEWLVCRFQILKVPPEPHAYLYRIETETAFSKTKLFKKYK